MQAPKFWQKSDKQSIASIMLLPLALIYKNIGLMRQKLVNQYKANIPVICIGNIVAGGAGKTPVALYLGQYIKKKSINIHYLSRGYGAKLSGVIKVDINNHSAIDVGDEPLLLAEIAPTWIAKNRVDGVKAAVDSGADIIIMDDGFQNPYLYKDLSLVVVDTAVGFGNGKIIPSGPLRETIKNGLSRADGVILIGDEEMPVELSKFDSDKIYHATLKPDIDWVNDGGKYVAFAGIGRPSKFFSSLKLAGVKISQCYSYGDHYNYKNSDLEYLRKKAKQYSAKLITTKKDILRISKQQRKDIAVFPIMLYCRESKNFHRQVDKILTDNGIKYEQ